MAGFTKREILGAPLAAAFGLAQEPASVSARQAAPKITSGRFDSSVESLNRYEVPAWFADAKFGIWAHWGPQAVPRQGDWYARFMYVPGHPHYDHHLKTYGHPSKKGYKDIIPLWTADRFDPEALMAKYKAAGAKYFVSMGVHHDNFDLWRSRHHRWNATEMGPKRDIVGAWKAAAKRQGLRFGVSEHLGASYTWWQPSHLYDQFWPMLGRSYDGNDARFADLYHDNGTEAFINTPESWYTKNTAFHRHWFDRISDLLDSYQPDLLYSDGGLPFGETGRSLLAHFYNSSVARSGRLEAVYNCKQTGSGEFHRDAVVQDVERGVLKGIQDRPWQTDTSNADWFFSDGHPYKSAGTVIGLLADIVSKNGNLLLNVTLYPDGSLPPESDQLLVELAAWMKVNAAAIHGTRPWKIHGEGPTETLDGMFREDVAYTAKDIRFTTRGNTLYAITLGEPNGSISIASLATGNPYDQRRIRRVTLLGNPAALDFRQDGSALTVALPDRLPTRLASTLQIEFA